MPCHQTCSLQVYHAESARSEKELHHFLQINSDQDIIFGVLHNIHHAKNAIHH